MFAFAGDFYGKTRSIKLINFHITVVFIVILMEIRRTKIKDEFFLLCRGHSIRPGQCAIAGVESRHHAAGGT